MAKVLHNQSLLDLSVQFEGTVLSAFDLAIQNQTSITDDLIVGQEFKNAVTVFRKNDVANYFKDKNQLIATKVGIQQPLALGIGTMKIESTFIVS
ncbi:hypothetical protein [Flavobacterium sp.]|uniref:hypothetical protein n=1 Tax=Flavobacterium sp. TaxID=239 RepID=UPI0037500E93